MDFLMNRGSERRSRSETSETLDIRSIGKMLLPMLIASIVLLPLLSAQATAASNSISWNVSSEWENGSYDKARVREGAVDIGIYPPEPRFEGSSWTFSKIYNHDMDDVLKYKREEGEAYFQALDVGDDQAGNDYGEALVYAVDNFYLDSAGVGKETLEFGWRAKPSGYDDNYDNTSLRIQLRKPGDTSWINLWAKEYTSFGGTESGTETIWISSELEYTGIYELRILVYWDCQVDYEESDEFEWYVDNLTFGFEQASHTTQWQDMGSTSSWKDLEATADIGLAENISARVEVSDDKNNVKDSIELLLKDGSNTFSISDLENARYVRIKSELYGGLNHAPELKRYRITAGVPQYDLNVLSDPVEGGSVDLDPSGGTYDEGTTVTLTADSASGYEFDSWSGDTSGTSTSVDVTMDSDKSITANFGSLGDNTAPDLFDGSVSPSKDKWGESFTFEVTYRDDDGDEPLPAVKLQIDGTNYDMTKVSGTYTEGATYQYNWTPSSEDIGSHRYSFSAYDGVDTAQLPEGGSFTDLEVGQHPPEGGTFSLNVVSRGGEGSVSVDKEKRSYSEGEEVTLSAEPEPGYEFVRWGGDVSGKTKEINVTMDSSKNAYAVFEEKPTGARKVTGGDLPLVWIGLGILIVVVVSVLLVRKGTDYL